MKFKEFKPATPLRRFIQSYWIIDEPNPNLNEKERVIPDGCMELILHLEEPFERESKNNVELIQPRAFFAGHFDRFFHLKPIKKLKLIGTRFRAHAPSYFFKISCDDFVDDMISVALIDKSLLELHEMIADADREKQIIKILDRFYLSRMRRIKAIDMRIESGVNQIIANNGNVSISRLALQLNLTPRRLEQLFSFRIGIEPKAFAKTIRFQNIFRFLQHYPKHNLTQISYCAGYYDQSHFNREFKQFTGVSPSKYVTEFHPISDFFTKNSSISYLYNFANK